MGLTVFSADTLKAISDLQLSSSPQAIFKVCPPSRLDYRACHGCRKMTLYIKMADWNSNELHKAIYIRLADKTRFGLPKRNTNKYCYYITQTFDSSR